MSAHNRRDCWHWCDTHGKRAYVSRRVARWAIRDMRDRKMRPYRCAAALGWHIGHLPRSVKRGEITAAEIYGEVS